MKNRSSVLLLIAALLPLAMVAIPQAGAQTGARTGTSAPKDGFPVAVDMVMTKAELAQYMRERRREGRTDDVVVGVLPDDASSRLTGPQEAETDERLHLAQLAEAGAGAAAVAPPCPPDDVGGSGVFLLCEGHEPQTVYRRRPIDPTAPLGTQLREAFAELASAPAEQGLWSPITELQDPIAGVRVVGTSAVVDLDDGVSELNLGAAFVGTTLIEALTATAMQFQGIESVRFQIEGSCEAFAMAIGGTGCPEFARSTVDGEESK